VRADAGVTLLAFLPHFVLRVLAVLPTAHEAHETSTRLPAVLAANATTF
jgi:hypothetical protein